jgi:hypothetical protein
MLEAQRLCLAPWVIIPDAHVPNGRGAHGSLRQRGICDAGSGAPLGYACERARPEWAWIEWLLLRRPVLAVHEKEDDSLLFTLHGGFRLPSRPSLQPDRPESFAHLPRRWQLRDADGKQVGLLAWRRLRAEQVPSPVRMTVRRPRCLVASNQHGRRLLMVEPEDNESSRTLWGTNAAHPRDWAEFGTVACNQKATVLTFAAALDREPFLKMLLLAAALLST